MKKVHALFLGLFSFFALVTSQPAIAKDVRITKSELPQKAIAFIDTYFTDKAISQVEKDVDFLSVSYKVTFADTVEIEFDKTGEWDEVDGNKTALPTSFILKPIVEYVTTHYSNASIVKIEKEARIFEVKLSNGLELEFSKSGDFKRIDN